MSHEEPITETKFEKLTNRAIADGYLGIDRNGRPTNDIQQLDSVGPGVRLFEPEQYILNESGHPKRLIACWADSARPLSLQVIGEGEIRLMTDRGERILHHGFEPAWDILGFLNAELPHYQGERVVSYFNPQLTASLLEAELLCGFGFQNPDWTPGRAIELVDETTAWNIIASKMEANAWTIGTVAAELTWIDDKGNPVPACAGFDMNVAMVSDDASNVRLIPFENMFWRLIMSLRRDREECAYADSFRHLVDRNAIFLAARLSHFRQLAEEYPDLGANADA